MDGMTRRQILQILGAGAVGIGCSSGDDPHSTDPSQSDAEQDALKAGVTGAEMLQDIDTIVVVMMENRTFDHYFGALKRDPAYANAAKVTGTVGNETNPAPNGQLVQIYKTDNFTLADPPHGFDASHTQFDNGKNDKFIIAHEGPNQNEVMAYYDRSQLPFYYWMADNFTICDHWFASVMGPTWPNRFYLHAGTSAGKKDNTPLWFDAPRTIWEQMRAAGRTTANYFAGIAPFFAGMMPLKLGVTRFTDMDEFFADAKAGTLPNLSYIDPDWLVSDDHPAHDIRLGQTFVASVYNALASSPQWGRSLLIVIYDEHGGFWDHVPPSVAPDADPDFRQFGFRVPAIIAGPTVKKGYLSTVQYDHTSVLATVAARFGLPALTTRSSKANVLIDVFDPKKYKRPAAPPANAPVPHIDAHALRTIGTSGQPELDAMIANGTIPSELLDKRPHDARVQSWLRHAEGLRAVKISR